MRRTSKPKPLPVPVAVPRDPKTYDVQKQKATSAKSAERLKLARDPKTHLEILYYLADDKDALVREAVASNPATPVQVSDKLAKDPRTEVRLNLAARLVALLPELSLEQHAHLYAHAVQALSLLALDEVIKVRLALSSALKENDYAPLEVVNQLARDVERTVAEPILLHCMKLRDEDLLAILAEHPQNWVTQAVAKRQKLSNDVARVIIKKGDDTSGKLLLDNKTALLSEDTLQEIVERAKTTPEWHRPLCLRSHLPTQILQEIVLFVDKKLQKMLFARKDLPLDVRDDLQKLVLRRVRFFEGPKGQRQSADEKLMDLFHQKKLDEPAMADALALREEGFVRQGLALRSGLGADVTQRMLATRSAKAITALVWKAGLSMRFALDVQKNLARLPHSELLYPKGGTDFPLDAEALNWQINFFKDQD